MFIGCVRFASSSVGAASVERGCRSYGAKTLIRTVFYKHYAPPELKRKQTCVETNARQVALLLFKSQLLTIQVVIQALLLH